MVGVDEVGRGALAGPLLVVAARPLNPKPVIGLKDSKLLTRNQREAIYDSLLASFQFGEGWVSPAEIDQLGLAAGLRLGARRATAAIGLQTDEAVLLDGNVNYLPKKYRNGRCEVAADANWPVVSAASIYAKVTRDRFMATLAGRHQSFSFASHVGYGTAQHQHELESYGPIQLVHRWSFAPIKQLTAL